MEKFMYTYFEIVQRYHLDITRNYRQFLESKFLMLVALIVIPSYMLFNIYLIFDSSKILSILFLIFTVFSLFIILPPTYSELKGRNFFNLKAKFLEHQKSLDSAIEFYEERECIIEKKPITNLKSEKIKILYSTLHRIKFLDSSCEVINQKRPEDDCFTEDNLYKTLNELKKSGKSDNYIYLTCMQKEAGFIINDVLKPLLGVDTKILCNYFYYYKGKKFIKIKYNSINAEKKRHKISAINNIISEIMY